MNGYTPLKCDLCGGPLIMDDSREFAYCEYCGTKYKKSTLQKKVQEIRGAVTVEGDVAVRQTDFMIRGGVLEKFNGTKVNVTIPDTVYIIGRESFWGCRGLREVIIPDSVTEIEYQAFYGCTNLQSIQLSPNIQKWGIGVFVECTSLQSITIPNGIKQIGCAAFVSCENLKTVRLPAGLTKIDSATFRGCKNLQSINIPDTVKIISSDAFSDCKNLRRITLPDGIEEISLGAFAYSGLTEINIPGSVREIHCKCQDNDGGTTLGAFENCSNLQNVTGNFRPFLGSFYNTPFRTKFLRASGLCQHCGGSFKGIFTQKCSICGRPKDY